MHRCQRAALQHGFIDRLDGGRMGRAQRSPASGPTALTSSRKGGHDRTVITPHQEVWAVPEVVELSYSECEALLRSDVAGRVAVSSPDGPHIIPMNYSVVDEAIVFRTSPTSILGIHGRDVVLAFEVDHFDYAYQRGWSVVARGRSEVVVDDSEQDHIRRLWPPRPWADGHRPLFLRLPWTELSGRRVGRDWDPFRDLPVRRVV